jgi:squalene synthase HpnC
VYVFFVAERGAVAVEAITGDEVRSASPPVGAPESAAVMAKAGSENFPVASRLLPRAQREHLRAIYGFARLVDDAGDESPGDRLALLDWLESDLNRLFAGTGAQHPIMQALAPTVAACGLGAGPFRRLIEANRRDQRLHRYLTFEELLDYCQLSAAPVGELVLGTFGAATPERIGLSDRICAGLQVTEHLQDVAEDRARGRTYLPREDMERFGCRDEDLAGGSPSEAFRELMAFEVERARALLEAGAPLVRTLPLRAALAVAAFVAGGRAALGALERAGYDVLGRVPRPSRSAFAAELVRTVVWP